MDIHPCHPTSICGPTYKHLAVYGETFLLSYKPIHFLCNPSFCLLHIKPFVKKLKLTTKKGFENRQNKNTDIKQRRWLTPLFLLLRRRSPRLPSPCCLSALRPPSSLSSCSSSGRTGCGTSSSSWCWATWRASSRGTAPPRSSRRSAP